MTQTVLIRLGYFLGTVLTIVGLIMRLSAYNWSRVPPGESWSGDWEATPWAFWREAYSDLGITIIAFGLALVLISFHRQLKSAPSLVNE